MNRPARGRRNFSGSRQGSVSDKNVGSSRKAVQTPIMSQSSNKDLERMKSDLNTISDRLNDVEKKLPVLHPKSPTSSRTSKQPDSARRILSNRTAYSAAEFNDETQLKTKRPNQSSGYLSRMSSLGESYDSTIMARISTDRAEQKRKNLVINIQKELKEWKDSHSKNISIQTDAVPEPSKRLDLTENQVATIEDVTENKVPCRESTADLPPTQFDDSPDLHNYLRDPPTKDGDSGEEDIEFTYPLDKYLSVNYPVKNEVVKKENSVEDWLKSLSMDNVKEMPVSSGLPPPKLILNQSSEYEVIDKAAKLLKKVEQHWKKSLFQNRLQFSPISDSLNSSESEHYIEKLAAIKFKDASFRNKQNCPAGEVQPAFRREASLEQNLLMRYDMVSNYFDLVGAQNVKAPNHPTSARMKDETCPVKCKRCLDKETAQSQLQKKSISVLPRQQYVLKHNSYSRRGGLDRKSVGRYNVQVSPRSNESLPTSRTFASAYSSPRNNINLSVKSRMSSSNPDLRNINRREYSVSPHQRVVKCCHNFCSTDKLNKLASKLNRPEASQMHPDIVDMSNVSVLNIKSTNQEDLTIPEVNPRKAPNVPDKMIIIQHLPQVDIRPELSKQTGPVISIEAETVGEEQKDLKTANIGVFNYIHKNETNYSQKEVKPFSNYSRYRRLSGNNGFSEEESFAAQLELRSVAENFIYRLKKNDNPSGLVLMSTLLLLMDEVNELIDVYMSDSTSSPQDPNLPPRMEMVSDLLSDELKTWGAQQPSHYQSLNNIIQHLILDIHFAKYGNFDLKELSNAVNQIKIADSKKSSILKKKKCSLNFDEYGRQRHISLSGETNKERSEATYRSTHSEEMSLSEKLLQENALKVQRLEKAYKINHRVRILQKKGESSNVEKTKLTNNVIESSNNHGSLDAAVDDDDKTEPSDDWKRQTSSNSSKSNSSHPVVAIISPSHDGSGEDKEEDQSISEKVSDAEDGSIDEELQEDKEDKDPEPIPEEDDTLSKPAEEPRSHEENHSDKPDSDAEEEVEEDISESSQPAVDEQKDSPATEYDEDFEVDDTENQSQSASVPTQNDIEKNWKQSHSQNMGVDEVCQTDDNEFPLLNKSIKQLIGENRSDGSSIKLMEETKSVLNERCNNGQSDDKHINTNQNGPYPVGNVMSRTHLWRDNANKRNRYKKLAKPLDNMDINDSSEEVLTKDLDNKENNFVKVHVRDELGEFILSFAGTKQNSDNKSTSSITKEKAAPEIQPVLSINAENSSHPSYNINNCIENERKNLDNLTKSILKELLDNKVHEILSKYVGEDKFIRREENDNLPSTSGVATNKDECVQTLFEISKNNLDKEATYKPLPEIKLDKEDDSEYQLKSPALKLNSGNEVQQDVAVRKENVRNVRNESLEKSQPRKLELNDSRDAGSYSPEVKLLISMVEEMDSSEVEYCEASLKLLSDEEAKIKPEVNNQNLRLHHFNSDEFLVYPRLNPQPSDIKVLQYSQTEEKLEISGDSKKSEEDEFRISYRANSVAVRNVATDCNLKNFRLHPLPETEKTLPKVNICSSSTQTVALCPSKTTSTLATTNLVELIEMSYSQSSSSSSNTFKEKSLKNHSEDSIKQSFPVRPVLIESTKERSPQKVPPLVTNPDINIPLAETHSPTSEKSQPSSTAQSEITSPNLFNYQKNERERSGRNKEAPEQNNEISSTSSETERSTSSDILESQLGLGGPMMRVLEMSAARANAWSSSSDSTTEDEKIFIMDQPVSDDDVLGDLEQLMNYLKNSKSSTSNVRMRQCSRHKKL